MPWDRADHDDLVALLERYDGAIFDGPSKIGPGIDRLFGLETFAKGIRRRGSGSIARMAPKRILASRLGARRAENSAAGVLDACRNAVGRTSWRRSEPISIDMATRTGSFRAISPTSLFSFEEAHIDHTYPTFVALARKLAGVVLHRMLADGTEWNSRAPSPAGAWYMSQNWIELLGSRALDRAIPRPPPQPSATLPRSHQRRRSAFLSDASNP